MDYFAGLDVSVKETSVCIVDDTGKIVREVKVTSEPEALLAAFLADQKQRGRWDDFLASAEHQYASAHETMSRRRWTSLSRGAAQDPE
jgi:hypothetical protein